MSDKRSNNRRNVSYPAVIQSGLARIGCTVVDVSTTGAKVRLEAGTFLGSDCTLASSLFREAVPSRIVWRRGSHIGLRFKSRVVRNDTDTGRPRMAASLIAGSWHTRT